MLSVKNLSYSYTGKENAVENVSFKMNTNEVLCLLGESGSGKSTLLKLIYGFLEPLSGLILFNDKKIKGPNYKLVADHPQIKIVQQNFNLTPYVTVAENIGEHLSNLNKEFKKSRIQEVAKVLEIYDLLQKKPEQLSGGQQQRVAIARAIANFPKLLLLDEPFSQLDANLHLKIRQQLIQYLNKYQLGCIFTSHRSDDALGFSDNILIMKSGKVVQSDDPVKLYNNPINVYVASLFGNYNILEGSKAHIFNLSRNFFKNFIIIYPHEIEINDNGTFEGRVINSRFFGKEFQIEVLSKDHLFYILHSKHINKNQIIRLKINHHRWV